MNSDNELLQTAQDKLNKLEIALIIETDPAVKFKLQRQLIELKQQVEDAHNHSRIKLFVSIFNIILGSLKIFIVILAIALLSKITITPKMLSNSNTVENNDKPSVLMPDIPEESSSISILIPKNNAYVKREVVVKGNILNYPKDNPIFLIIKSVRTGKIYPQGEITNFSDNSWSIQAYYGAENDKGYEFETFIVSTAQQSEIDQLKNKQNRKHGLAKLPEFTEKISHSIVNERQ